MNPLDRRKHLAAFSKKIRRGGRVTKAQALYLANVFERISKGEDANYVLGVKYSRGQSQNDAIGRQKLSEVLHWVACAIDPDTGHGYTLEAALSAARVAFRYPHDLDYLRKKWYEHPHMQSPCRTWRDQDSPFQP